MSKDAPSPPKRQAVSIVLYPDGHAEAYADRNVDVRFVRVPVAQTRGGEEIAEECARMLTPRRYADLWRADLLRACGSTAPLRVEAIQAALAAKDCIATLEPFMPPKPTKKRGAA